MEVSSFFHFHFICHALKGNTIVSSPENPNPKHTKQSQEKKEEKAMSDNSVDLCFVLDCTGSMGGYMNTVKTDISKTVRKVADEVPDVEINYGFVCYRDWCDGDKRIETFPFNTNMASFQSFVGSLAATGGGDYPEDVLGGLMQSANMTWTSATRVLFHIFDAPPHGRPKYHSSASDDYPSGHSSDPSLATILGRLRDDDVDYYMCKLNNDLDQMVRVFKSEAASVGYDNIEERSEIDLSKIMADVAEAVLESMAVRVSRRGRRRRADPRFRPRLTKNKYKVYCGIDFGTHGSAYAFCTPTDHRPYIEQNWEGNSGDVKTLTNLLLGPNKRCVPGANGFGDAALEHYLNMDPEEQHQHYLFRRFKMALYEKALGEDARDEKTDIENSIRAANGKTVKSERVLEEALKFMVSHVMEQIERLYEGVSIEDVQWIITVPAIWSPKSRKIMERAAYRAGVPKEKHDQLIVALEPECASIVVKSHSSLGLDVGDAYMLVDCGGGTVDITCHELETKTDVKEIWMASGGPWGATYIDDAFMDFLRQVFGEEVMNRMEDEIKSGEDPGLKEELIRNFNRSKVHATADEESRNVQVRGLRDILSDVFGSAKDINAHLEGAVYNGVRGGAAYRRGTLTLSRQIWDALFGTVINPMVDHIRGLLSIPELDEKLKTLCIVGGFAESNILMTRLAREFADRRVYRPEKPILAVVQGAAMYGCVPTSIRERRAQRTVGIAIRDEWNDATDYGHKKIRDRFLHMDCVDNVLFPFIKKGQAIPTDMDPVTHYFEPTHRERFVIQIFLSEEDEPPRFAPPEAALQIGPIVYPEEYERDADDILVEFDFSGVSMKVKVQFGEMEPMEAELSWEG